MPAIQGKTYRLMFALSDAAIPTNPFNGVPFAAGEVQITKPGGAPADAVNIATITHRGDGIHELVVAISELALGLAADETGEIVVRINKTGALPRQVLVLEVLGSAPPTAAAIAAEVAAALAASLDALPTNAELAAALADVPAAVDAQIAGDFGAVTTAVNAARDVVVGEIAAIPAAPSAVDVAAAVGALEDADGVPLLEHQAMVGAMLYGDGTFPDDGAFQARALSTQTVRVAGTVAPTTGVRTVTTRTGA